MLAFVIQNGTYFSARNARHTKINKIYVHVCIRVGYTSAIYSNDVWVQETTRDIR